MLEARGGNDPEILQKILSLEKRRTELIRHRLARHRERRVAALVSNPPPAPNPFTVQCESPRADCTRSIRCACPAALACALAACDWRVERAAKLIGVTGKTIYRRLRKWGFRKSPTHKGWTM